MNDKKLSIIIPVFNSEKYIDRCINSITNQIDVESVEVILIDDGSTDKTPMFCDLYSNKYNYIRVIHQKNLGVSMARNSGIKMASGEYIMFIDADDFLVDDALKHVEDVMKFEADYVIFSFDKQYKDKSWKRYRYSFSDEIVSIEEINVKFIIDGGNAPWAKLFKKKIIQENHLTFSIQMKIHEDVQFCLRYLQCCKQVYYSSKSIYRYAYNPNGAISKHKLEYLRNYNEIYYELKSYILKFSNSEQIAEQLEKIYLRKLVTTSAKLIKYGIDRRIVIDELNKLLIVTELCKASYHEFFYKILQKCLEKKLFYAVSKFVK